MKKQTQVSQGVKNVFGTLTLGIVVIFCFNVKPVGITEVAPILVTLLLLTRLLPKN